jgi:hypothetical protein
MPARSVSRTKAALFEISSAADLLARQPYQPTARCIGGQSKKGNFCELSHSADKALDSNDPRLPKNPPVPLPA